MKHTKGPWKTDEVAGMEVITISECGYMPHAQVFRRGVGNNYLTDEDRANARLIAAAPELLEASKQFIASIKEIWNDSKFQSRYGHIFDTAYGMAREVVAKAEGRE
jgi:hypothetical protein